MKRGAGVFCAHGRTWLARTGSRLAQAQGHPEFNQAHLSKRLLWPVDKRIAEKASRFLIK